MQALRRFHFIITATLLVGFMLSSTLASAQVLSAIKGANAYFGRGIGVLSKESLRQAGVTEVKTLANETHLFLNFLGPKGDVLKSFVIERATPDVLSQFRPSKFRQWSKTLQATSGGIMKSKMLRFPYEALAFFSAIGAINMYDLIFHYQNNPVIMNQFIESQKDPLTHASFMAFMAVNGLAAEPLQEVIQNRKMHYFLPYFGMSMGMMASNVVHDLASAHSLQACAGAMLTQQSNQDQLCDKAFDEMQSGWNSKWGQYATGWMSMMGSTMLGGVVDWAAANASRKVMQFIGLEIAFSMGTGGGGTVGRFLWTVVKNTQFLAVDAMLRVPIENIWMNTMGTASELDNLGICLGTLHQLYRVDLNGHEHPRKAAMEYAKIRLCPDDLVPTILKMSEKNREFRVENMRQVLSAHQSWQTYLSDFASHYRSSRVFYQHLTDQIWKRNYMKSAKSPLDQLGPYFGVLPPEATEVDWTVYLQDFSVYEQQQLTTINLVGARLKDWMNQPQMLAGFTFAEQRKLKAWAENLSSKSEIKIQEALREMNQLLPGQEIVPASYGLGAMPMEPVSIEYRRLMQETAAQLGQPSNTRVPGEAFLKAWSHWQARDDGAIQEGVVRSFPKNHREVSTPSIPESLIMSMTDGPDIENGETVIDKNGWGGLAAFHPPRIITQGNVVDLDSETINPATNALENIFTNQIQHEKFPCSAGRRACGRSNWEYLRGGWIRPQVMTSDGNNMAAWWSQKVETPYIDAWYDFELVYEKIVKDLANQLFATDHPLYIPFTQIPLFNLRTNGNDMTNASGFANAAFPNLAQERSIYLLFLSDYLNASQSRAPVADDVSYRIQTKAAAELNRLHRTLIPYLREWDKAIGLFPAIRNNIENQLDPDKGLLLSRASNEQIEAAVKSLDESLASLSESFLGQVPPEDEPTLQAMLGGLKATHQELLDFGLILNTASYVENHGSPGKDPVRQRCVQLPAASGSSIFRGESKGCP